MYRCRRGRSIKLYVKYSTDYSQYPEIRQPRLREHKSNFRWLCSKRKGQDVTEGRIYDKNSKIQFIGCLLDEILSLIMTIIAMDIKFKADIWTREQKMKLGKHSCSSLAVLLSNLQLFIYRKYNKCVSHAKFSMI